MSSPSQLEVDFSQHNALGRIGLNAPLLSSYGHGWRGIQFAQHRQGG